MGVRDIAKIGISSFPAFAIFLLIGEAAIRIYLHFNMVYDIEMTKYAMHVKVDAENPLIGHVHRPNASMRLMNSMVDINSDGLRDREYPLSRNDKYRAIILGDSLTFGWGVEQEDTFENLLEEMLNRKRPVELINFGAGNYNTEQQVNLFLEKGLPYKPDKVVVFYFINDAEVTPEKSKLWFLGYSQLISFYWSRVNAFINKNFSSSSFDSFYSTLYQDDKEGWSNAKKAFLKLRDTCQGENIELQVVLLPELHDVDGRIFKNVYDKVFGFLDSNGIGALNLASIFAGYENPMQLWVSFDDAHPNELAHQRIAENSLEFISQGLIQSD